MTKHLTVLNLVVIIVMHSVARCVLKGSILFGSYDCQCVKFNSPKTYPAIEHTGSG